MTRRDVVGVGSAIVDRYYSLSNLPEPDGGAFVNEEWQGYGGVAGNVVAAASELGRDAGMIARLGDDGDADAVERNMREAWGVDTDRFQRGDERSTYCMVLRGPSGERMAVTGGVAAKELRIGEADLDYCRDAAAVFTNAYVPDPVTAPLVDARAEGAFPPLVFDLSGPLPELEARGTTPETIDRAVEHADLFVAGEVALRSYLDHHGIDTDDPAVAADALRDLGVSRAALTRGEAGALLVTPDGTVDVPAYDVETVDATGAGDAFSAGLIDAWLLDDRDPFEAGRHAAAVAALNCTGDGARGGLPTREEIQAFRDRRD